MRKWIALCLSLVMAFALAACGGQDSALSRGASGQTAGVADVLAAQMAETQAPSTDAGRQPEPPIPAENGPEQSAAEEPPAITPAPVDTAPARPGTAEGIDVDLTALSSTMVYAEVYNMITAPEQYRGKVVKMEGLFDYYHNEATDVYYFACVIQDATACCAQGLEFVLTDEYTYPDDYPQVAEPICVVGVFDTYVEGGTTYITLRDARLQ